MSLSPILSRDIVTTRLLFNAIKREKYINFLTDAVVGDYKWSACNVSFHGWMKCDGSALPVAQYGALHNVIGYTYGGSGANFNLPDCRGRALFAAGQPTGGNIEYNAHTLVQGERFGNQKHKLELNEMPSHNHTGKTDSSTLVDTPESETVMYGAGAEVSGQDQRRLDLTTNFTGGDVPHDIQNPSIVVGNVFLYSGYYEPYVSTVDVIGPNDNDYNA
jgi:microcystin-dependent protein